MTVFDAARGLLNRLGVKTHPADIMTMWELRLPKLLTRHGVRTVLDVGAKDGAYASGLLRGGFAGGIISFEPLPAIWAQLERRTLDHPSWSVAPPMALSDVDRDDDTHLAGSSIRASLLAMPQVQTSAAAAGASQAIHTLETRRLDSILSPRDAGAPFFLRIDAHGAERAILEGASESLRSLIVGVQLEMSIAPLRQGQASASDLDALLRERGFICWDICPGSRDPSSLRMLKYDGVYFRGVDND